MASPASSGRGSADSSIVGVSSWRRCAGIAGKTSRKLGGAWLEAPGAWSSGSPPGNCAVTSAPVGPPVLAHRNERLLRLSKVGVLKPSSTSMTASSTRGAAGRRTSRRVGAQVCLHRREDFEEVRWGVAPSARGLVDGESSDSGAEATSTVGPPGMAQSHAPWSRWSAVGATARRPGEAA